MAVSSPGLWSCNEVGGGDRSFTRTRRAGEWPDRRGITCNLPDVLEISTFRLADDVGEADFLLTNANFQQRFVYLQEGLLRRTVASGLDGEWVSITWWRSMNDARRSAVEAQNAPVALEFNALVDAASLTTQYFKELPG